MGHCPVHAPRKRPLASIAFLSTTLFITGCFGAGGADAPVETAAATGEYGIMLKTQAIPLNVEDEDQERVGSLIYRGGLVLSSDDRRFGGLSGLRVTPDGRTMTAVSDAGYWFRAQMEYKAGRLSGLNGAKLAPLLNPKGNQVKGKVAGDAEGLERFETDYFVSFEHYHRVWRYAVTGDLFTTVPVPVDLPDSIGESQANKGLEGIAITNGRLVLMTEHTLDRNRHIRGWIGPAGGGANRFQSLALKRKPPYQVTDMAPLPGGDLLVLERRFSRIGGIGMRLRQIRKADLQGRAPIDGPELADLDGSYNIDNMEGLSVRRTPDGRTVLYILSDNNYNPIQRTVLLMFELAT